MNKKTFSEVINDLNTNTYNVINKIAKKLQICLMKSIMQIKSCIIFQHMV